MGIIIDKYNGGVARWGVFEMKNIDKIQKEIDKIQKEIDKIQKEIDKSIRIRDHIIPIVSNLIMVMVGLLGIICFTLETLGKIKPERTGLLFKVLRNLG